MPARDTLQSRGEWRKGFFLNGQQPRAPSLRDLLAALDEEIARAQVLRARERAN